jgi:predicted ATPase
LVHKVRKRITPNKLRKLAARIRKIPGLMNLKELRIKGFKTYSDLTLQPRRLNVMVGKNDSGKTNLCLALSFLSDLLRTDTRRVTTILIGSGNERIKYGPLESIRCRFSDGPLSFTYFFECDGVELRYSISIHPTSLLVEYEELLLDGKEIFLRQSAEVTADDSLIGRVPSVPFSEPLIKHISPVEDAKELLNDVAAMLKRAWYFDLHYNELLKGARGATSMYPDDLDFNSCGSDLSAVIGHLFDGGTEKVVSFQEEMRTLFGIKVGVSTEGSIRKLRITDETQPQKIILTDELAHGTLKAIYLAALRHLEIRNSIFIFDELENGLNPKLYEWAVSTLGDMANRGNYIFTTCHCPLILNLTPFFDFEKDGFAETFFLKRGSGHATKVQSMSEIIAEKYHGNVSKFWEEVPVPLGELWLTDYFDV